MNRYAVSLIAIVAVQSFSQNALASGFEIIAPHRAIYEIKLKSASERSGIRAMKGRMVYEVRGNECEGISLKYRFLSTVSTARDEFLSDQHTSTYESADGKNFNFFTKTFLNEQLEETVKGRAKQTGSGVNVVLDQPEKQEFEFSKANFLTSHLINIIEKGKNGEHFLRADLFDGSDGGDETISTSTVISGEKSIADSKNQVENPVTDKLDDLKAWSVAMSYFKKNIGATSEHLPIFESSFLLFENGVSTDLEMRYPDYILKGNLSSLELFDSEPCKKE